MAAPFGPAEPGSISRLTAVVVAAATVLVLLAISIVVFLNPAWVRLEQDRSGVGALTGYTSSQLDAVAAGLIGDLALWQGDFRVAVDGRQVLNEREVSHMRDVRSALWGGLLLAMAGAALTVVVLARAAEPRRRASVWSAIRAGARATVVGVLLIGAFAVLAFPVFFELFHRLFFSAGTYTFDPASERLVQLFPTQFWSDTTIAIGTVVLALALLAWWAAGRRAAGGNRTSNRSTARAAARPGGAT